MILNLTQHHATHEQLSAGVVDMTGDKHKMLIESLTFAALPNRAEIIKRAHKIAYIARNEGARSAMIGGAPYLMSALEEALVFEGIAPLYAFSERVSVEETLHDGSVRKTNMFKHIGFVDAL